MYAEKVQERRFRAKNLKDGLVQEEDDLFGGQLWCVTHMKSEFMVAQQDVVAGAEASRAGKCLSVQVRSVFGRNVVQLAAEIAVYYYRTVATGDALVADHNIVIGQTTDAIHPEM